MHSLWYDRPGKDFMEALPLGNGRLGMMPDGGVDEELVVLNEITMWAGCPDDNGNPEAAKALPRIREYLLNGENQAAQQLMYRTFVPKDLPLQGGSFGNYQLLANLNITYQYDQPEAPVEEYERLLDLETATLQTEFTKGGNEYRRSYFVSRPADVMVIHLEADHSNLSFRASLNRPKCGSLRVEQDRLILEGRLPSGKKDVSGLAYQTQLRVRTKGGEVSFTRNGCEVKNASEADILISASTDYHQATFAEQVDSLLDAALSKPISVLERESIEAYFALYDRAHLRIGKGKETPKEEQFWLLPTDQRLEHFTHAEDPSIAQLYFDFGRYLFISSTKEGLLPSNLQGLWANSIQTPWNGDYHLNINVQMNHWFVETINLPELHLPLAQMVKNLVPSGEKTATDFYGPEAKGWVAHMKTNLWNFTAPGQHPSWGATNTGGAWLCAHLWEHYLYTQDLDFLKEYYPVMKGAAEFFLSTMITERSHGWLVTAPSSSPENAYFHEGVPTSVCMGPTMDNQLMRELFGNVLAASELLGIDADFRQQLAEAIAQLPPHQISQDGYLLEWLEDYPETDVEHRHVSHLYGLYPGKQVSLEKTPELAKACARTIERRDGVLDGTIRKDRNIGWTFAWKMNLWARLGEAEKAYRMFHYNLIPRFGETSSSGITFPNLLNSCAGFFQVDGCFGATAGILEMLLQSHDGYIHFLPALPKEWSEGLVEGLCVRGGALVDYEWKDGELLWADIHTDQENTYMIKMPEDVREIRVISSAGKKTYSVASFYSLVLKAGETAHMEFIR